MSVGVFCLPLTLEPTHPGAVGLERVVRAVSSPVQFRFRVTRLLIAPSPMVLRRGRFFGRYLRKRLNVFVVESRGYVESIHRLVLPGAVDVDLFGPLAFGAATFPSMVLEPGERLFLGIRGRGLFTCAAMGDDAR